MVEALTTRKTTSGRVLLPWQEAWRRDQSDLKIWEKSRRIGATYTEANDVAMTRLTGERPMDYWFSSADESAAYEFADYVRFWVEKAGSAASTILREEVEDEATGKKGTSYVVRFPDSPFRMTAMTSNPRRFRSKGGDIGLDEFAYHDQPSEMYRAAEPCTMWGGKLRILSTHNGQGSEFNRLCEMGRRVAAGQGLASDIPFSLHKITLIDAVQNGLVERINETRGTHWSRAEFIAARRKQCRDEDHWLQEYMAVPSMDSSALLTWDLIESCQDSAAGRIDLVAGGPEYVGMDIGEKADRTPLLLGEMVGDVLWVRQRRVYREEPMREKEAAYIGLLNRSQVVRGKVDATGLGTQIGQAGQAQGKGESVKFTAPIKDYLATLLLRRFQDKTIRIPADGGLRDSLHQVRKSVSATGTVRYEAQRTEEGHADDFWALALLCDAAGCNDVPYCSVI